MPDPGLAAPAVPGPGSPYSQLVIVEEAPSINYEVFNLLVRCAETGVTLNSKCGGITFYQNTTGTKHYSTPGGTGHICASDQFWHTYGSASGSGSGTVTITVTRIS